MKNLSITLLFIATIFTASAQDLHEYSLKVGEFNQLKVQNNANVVYSVNPDSIGYAWFSGEKKHADIFLFSNSNGTLKIEVKTSEADLSELPVIHISSTFLTSVESSSKGIVNINRPAPSVDFKATLIGNGSLNVDNVKATKVEASLRTGNGSISITGECDQAKLNMLGVGVIQADGLKASAVDCKILGSGSIGCWAEQNLRVTGIGSTKIYYKGNPTIRKSGGGKLFSLEEKAD